MVAWVRVDGEIFAVPDLATLQRWVLEKRVLPDDRCSSDGNTWSAIGDRPELGLFFEAADRLDRSSSSAQHALMTMAHSDAEDVFADPTPERDDGYLTELPGGLLGHDAADAGEDEPIPAGDEGDDEDDDEPASASLSFSVDRVQRPAVERPAGDAATAPRPVGAAPAAGSGTASVRIAPPALPEAVQDAPAAVAYALAESELAARSSAAPAHPATVGREAHREPEAGAPDVYVGWDEDPEAFAAEAAVAAADDHGAEVQAPVRPSARRLLTPPGARLGAAVHPLPAPLPASAMPDFRAHPADAAQTDEPAAAVAHPLQAHAPHVHDASASPAPHPRGTDAQAPAPRTLPEGGGLSGVVWLVILVLVAAAVVGALWMNGPSGGSTRTGADAPASSKRLPAGTQPIVLPPTAPPPVLAPPPVGVPVPSMAAPTAAPPTAPVAPAPVTAAPVTAAPVTAAPVTAAPVTAAPVTAAPVTAAPVTAAPTAPPTQAPRLTGRAAAQPGWTAVEREQWATARAAFDRVLAVEPGNAWAAYGRAYVAERTGDLETARTAYCNAERRAGTGDLARDIQAGARRVSATCPP